MVVSPNCTNTKDNKNDSHHYVNGINHTTSTSTGTNTITESQSQSTIKMSNATTKYDIIE